DIVQDYKLGLEIESILIKIGFYLLALIVLSLIQLVLSYITNYVDRNFRVTVATMLFDKLKQIDYDFHENTNFLNNYTRSLEEGPDRIYFCAYHQITLIRTIVQSLGVFAVISQMHPYAVFYAIVIGLIFILIKNRVGKINYQQRSIERPILRKRNYLNRVFFLKDSMADLKTTAIESLLLKSHNQLNQELIKVYDHYAFKKTIWEFIGNLFIAFIYPGILGIVAYYAFIDMQIAAFASLTVAATTISNLISRLVNVLANIQIEMIESRVPFILLSMTSNIEGKGGCEVDEFQSLSINHVDFGYDEKVVLHNINIQIKQGDKIAIVGANGAGKTTLVKLMLRLYDTTNGDILYNNESYKNIDPNSLREKVGAVFQNPEVYSVTIGENVILKPIETKEEEDLVIKALKFSGLYDDVMRYEEGINTLVTREFQIKGAIFSGGQTQKLAIARGFAQNYQLFILDEPSSSLDPLAEAALYQNMLELGRDKTLLFISHRLSTTINCDYIYLFANGEIIESGRHDALMRQKGKYWEMFNSQSEKYLGGEQND
ncbi:MAG: ABC transporter ATP-binding protein, partial [Bacilli bacterium]|nr:ABC transporter ATP-binding protein [Bacilli bacterium]